MASSIGPANDYVAQIVGLEDEVAVCFVANCESAHDAAQSYAAGFVEDTQGQWTQGAIRVWPRNSGPDAAIIFDVVATIKPYEDDDAEEGEVECTLEVTERG
jgi:hypothetical protein